jgi:hypothetical protein
MHDVNILDELLPEAGAFYIMDRGYLDFERLARLMTPEVFLSHVPSPTSKPGAAIHIPSIDQAASSVIKRLF